MQVSYNDGRLPAQFEADNMETLAQKAVELSGDPGVEQIVIKRLRPKKGIARLPKKNAPLSALREAHAREAQGRP